MKWHSASSARQFRLIKSHSYDGSSGRILTDPTGERRKRRFRQHFRGLRSCRSNPSGESGLEPSTSRLRWVYASYFVPEITTAPNESWAITETTAPYKVGSHNTKWPLPDHLLLSRMRFTVGGVLGPECVHVISKEML